MKRYPKYKPSGVGWVGEIPSHWDLKRLKYAAVIQSGYAFKSDEFVDNGIPLIRIGDVAPIINLENCKKTSEINIPDEFRLKKNDTLIALSGATVGKMCFVENDMEAYINQRVARVTNGTKWMHHVLNSEFFIEQIELIAGGSAQENISTNDIANFFIPIPFLPEQTAIANYLDEKTAQIDKLISNKQKLIELLKEERAAIINDAVSGEGKNWERKKLKYLTELISKGTTPSTVGAEIIDEGEVRYLKAENILPSNIISDIPQNFIDLNTNEILKRSELKDKDVLIVIAGATIGKIGILRKELLPANTNQAVCFIRLENKELSNWIWFYLQSNSIKENISIDAVQSAQPNLSMEKLGNFVTLIPPTNKRKEVEILLQTETQRIDNTISKIEKEIELMQEYRTALISEAVTGKIDVREYTIPKG